MSVVTEALARLRKGDAPGHEFRGNQHTSHGGAASAATSRAHEASDKAEKSGSRADARAAAEAHQAAAQAHGEASYHAKDANERTGHERTQLSHEKEAQRYSSKATGGYSNAEKRAENASLRASAHSETAHGYDTKAGHERAAAAHDKAAGAHRDAAAAAKYSSQRDGHNVVAHMHDTKANVHRAAAKTATKAEPAGELGKGDAAGHAFRGNQYKNESAQDADQQARDHRAMADHHRRESRGLEAQGKHDKALEHARAANAHDDASGLFDDAAKHHEAGEGKKAASSQRNADRFADDAYARTKKLGMARESRKLVEATLEQLRKGDSAGHPFRGNQYKEGTSQNEGYGYHGEAYHALTEQGKVKEEDRNDRAHEQFKQRAAQLVLQGHFKTNAEARDFLDSRAGRHYHDALTHGTSGKELPHSVGSTKQSDAVIRDYKRGWGKDSPGSGSKAARAELAKGDVVGHEFHGNQHTGGKTYAQRVREHEEAGMSTSDAQGAADAEHARGANFAHNPDAPGDPHGAPNKMRDHPNYSPSDYQHLKSKGYTDKEVKALWDRDRGEGKGPVHHAPIPDVMGVLTGKPSKKSAGAIAAEALRKARA